MVRKELLKELIVSFQQSLPKELYERDLSLPIDIGKIVVATGVRRCGKSSALQLTMNQLLQQGILPEQILFMNFDDERLSFNKDNLDLIIQAYNELYPNRSANDIYLFFDEIQMADDWEQFVRRVYDSGITHIYLTGSNSRLLSSEIDTSLRGRTLQYQYFPLSFKEYCRFHRQPVNIYDKKVKTKLVNLFSSYLQTAFPELVEFDESLRQKVLQEYYYIMIYRDLVERFQITNVVALKYFIRRLAASICKPTSINKIFNELKSAGITVGKNSLYEWVEHFNDIYLFLPLHKYEPSMVKELSSERKFYAIDNGITRMLVHSTNDGNGALLENQVFLYLKSTCDERFSLYFYKEKKECDFVLCEHDKVVKLIQVTWEMSNEDTLKREVVGLLEASKQLHCNDLTIITNDEEYELPYENGKVINVVPAWKYFLMDR